MTGEIYPHTGYGMWGLSHLPSLTIKYRWCPQTGNYHKYTIMKNTTITAVAALLLGTAGTFAQDTTTTTSATTTPVGFVTHTLRGGQFNLLGVTLHQPVLASGAFTGTSTTTVTCLLYTSPSPRDRG